MERIMDDNELKRADVNRVFKEVNDNLKAGWVYPYNFIKCDYLKYGYCQPLHLNYLKPSI
jgi:hypothetical protein